MAQILTKDNFHEEVFRAEGQPPEWRDTQHTDRADNPAVAVRNDPGRHFPGYL